MRFPVAALLLGGWLAAMWFSTGPADTLGAEPQRLAFQDGNKPREAAPVTTVAVPQLTNIDPVAFLPQPLTQVFEAEAAEMTLGDLARWLKTKYGIPTVIDTERLDNLGLPPETRLNFPAVPSLPIYLVLDRQLPEHDLDWLWDRGVLRITTVRHALKQHHTECYNVGRLLKTIAGNDLKDVIMQMTGDEEFGPWTNLHGTGGMLDLVGDILIVRQTQRVHRAVRALLQALESPQGETYIDEPSQNMRLRAELSRQQVSADLWDAKLQDVIADWSEKTGLPMDLDVTRMADNGITPEVIVTLQLPELPLDQMLSYLLEGCSLEAVVWNGSVRVTPREHAPSLLRTVVYDIRDLLPAIPDRNGILAVLLNETGDEDDGPWMDVHGRGGVIASPAPGVLIVRQNDRVLGEIRNLLANLRSSLASGPTREPPDPNRMEVRYYRVPNDAADDLLAGIVSLIHPESWQQPANSGTDGRPSERIGTIQKVRTGMPWSTFFDPSLRVFGCSAGITNPPINAMLSMPAIEQTEDKSAEEKTAGITAPTVSEPPPLDAVLIVRHRAAVHDEIRTFLNHLLFNNPAENPYEGSVPTGKL